MAAVLMIAFVFSQTEEKNMAYLTIDINPSIELIIGKDHIVTSALALNTDAEAFNLGHYKGLSIQNALMDLISEAQQLGYITPEEKSAEIAIGYIPTSKKAASFGDIQNDIKTVHDNTRLTQTLQNVHIRLFEATKNELNASLKAKETLSKWVYEHASIPRNQIEFEAPQSRQNLPKDAIEENADTDTSPKTDDADNGTEATDPVNAQPDATTQATETQMPTTIPDATTSATASALQQLTLKQMRPLRPLPLPIQTTTTIRMTILMKRTLKPLKKTKKKIKRLMSPKNMKKMNMKTVMTIR